MYVSQNQIVQLLNRHYVVGEHPLNIVILYFCPGVVYNYNVYVDLVNIRSFNFDRFNCLLSAWILLYMYLYRMARPLD